MGSKEAASESVEFYISRAVDPFLTNEKQLLDFLNKICTRITKKPSEIPKAIQLLTHKVLSPNQEEAFASLNALEFVVKKCPALVSDEINNLSTLNVFIQVLSPEQSNQTSRKNREKAISVLFEWKESMSNLENISKVYSMLKSRKLIDSDPRPTSQHKSDASTKDEEKTQLINKSPKSRLLEYPKEEKPTVKNDGQQIEGTKSQQEVVEMGRMKVQLLNNHLNSEEPKESDREIMQELFQSLIQIRPSLFQFSEDGGKGNEQEEQLALVEKINNTIERYRKFEESKNVGKPADHENRPESSVRFDPESIKVDKNSGVNRRKPTPHSKVTEIDRDSLRLFAATTSHTGNSSKRPSNSSSINEEMETLELSASPSPNNFQT